MKLVVIFILFFNVWTIFSQKEKPQNYKRFDEHRIHFGFMLGFNKSDFTVFQKIDAYQQYGLLSLTSSAVPGGQLGIVSSLRLWSPMVRLRFLPSLSFQERVLNYTFLNKVDPKAKNLQYEERVGSTNLDFPLMLQLRTLRLNNFAAYLLIGAQYSMDLQSQEKASQSYTDPFIKIKKNDYQAQAGAGVEFFAPYFKFGIEMKYSRGFNNSFIQDNTEPSNPIDRLYNKTLWVSFIFEG